MKSVLTVIAASDKEKLGQGLVNDIVKALEGAGAQVIGQDWLAPDEACDIVFSKLEPVAAEEAARAVIGDLAIDCLAQDTDGRQKKLLISDMDSTIITIECIDEIADFAGIKEQVAAITERAMRGELDFIAALRERVELLKGLEASVLQQVYNERVRFMPGARELVQTMRANGAYTLLVSGGFDFFTSRVQEALGFHDNSANRLEVSEGRLTGHVLDPILDKQAKLSALMQACGENNLSTSQSLAVGDGANDLPMIMAAGLGAAYHAKPVVQQSARARINHCDLTALLYMQGYRKDEFVK
ncbi:MAG TPA: phosphoserine phosphatase SerB [Rickettsiales bacterium]|nr:phosphoserine phosphatase SerB [Rickettsiales bacterium]